MDAVRDERPKFILKTSKPLHIVEYFQRTIQTMSLQIHN